MHIIGGREAVEFWLQTRGGASRTHVYFVTAQVKKKYIYIIYYYFFCLKNEKKEINPEIPNLVSRFLEAPILAAGIDRGQRGPL